MKYLLDTCVISDFIKGDAGTLKKIKEHSPVEFATSTITLMEIQYGLALNSARAKKIKPIIYDFLRHIHILEYTQDHARETALIRTMLRQRGTPIGSYDVLLAGTALSQKLILVSANTREFEKIEQLTLENWRTSIISAEI